MLYARILVQWRYGADGSHLQAVGLMRDKWERDDTQVCARTSRKSCTSFYKPVRVTSAVEDQQLRTAAKFDLLNNPRYRFGDIGFGRLFADVYKDICRFVRAKEMVRLGKCWQADVGSLKAGTVQSLADDLLQYALTINEEHLRTNFLKECGKWQQRRFGKPISRSPERLSFAVQHL